MDKFFEISDFPLFKDCDEKTVEMLISTSSNRMAVYERGDIVAVQGSKCRSLLLLCEGSVKTVMTNSEGKEIKIETMHAPEILASAFIYGSENLLPVTIEATSSCKLWIISKDGFLNMMQKDATLLQNFLKDISDRSLFLSRKLNEFALQNLNTRLIGYMKRNSTIHNLQELAFILGVARPSLSRAVAMLVEQGIVIKSENGYELSAEYK
ncbi:Crp/Fnr family transcriptional regulator [Phocaeicola paurosaccharolyticus]|uniref:Crp/Fnr family transcriptional regulator n=1 Tax=Phocaeicola paurosaccharolyticus TaxID=732242 RepID=UPI002FE0E7C2